MRRMYSKPQLLEAVEQEAEINGIKVFEDIKDKDGHNRFIEGEIAFEEVSGITKTYAKWSLSGSHLMLVLCANVANGTVLSGTLLASIGNIPSWIYDKIVPIAGNLVYRYDEKFYASDGTNQTVSVFFYKGTKLAVNFGTLTLSADRSIRIALDLLID